MESDKKMKICFAASSGGHYEQLMMLKPLMEEYDSFVVTEQTDYSAKAKGEKTYYMSQVNRREKDLVWKMLKNAWKSLQIYKKEKPDVVICTGVLAMIPMCLIAKMAGKKLIYIESFAKVTSPTETGKLLYKFADQFYVQWEIYCCQFILKQSIWAAYINVGTQFMIFITLGSQKFQFNRLLKAIDKLVEQGKIKEEVFAQIGYSDYQPINYNYKQFLDRDEFAAMEGKADIVITHGGTGAIIGAVKKGKKVIAVPRLAKYGEHVDDHQLQLLKEFEDMNIIVACYDTEKLGDAYESIRDVKLQPYKSNQQTIISSIEKYLKSL